MKSLLCIAFLVALALLCPVARRAGRRGREAFDAIASPAAEWADEQARDICSYVTAAWVDGKPGEGARFCFE